MRQDDPDLQDMIFVGGWTARYIAPLFSGASSNLYFDTAWREHLPQDAAFWGTF